MVSKERNFPSKIFEVKGSIRKQTEGEEARAHGDVGEPSSDWKD